MIVVNNTKLGEHRGKPRIWLEGRKLAHSYSPDEHYDAQLDKENKRVVFVKNPNGQHKVSVRRRNGNEYPIIDFKDESLTELFSFGVLLRVVIKSGLITIEVHSRDKKRNETIARIIRKITEGEPLATGSTCTGGGVLDRAIHEGLKASGIESYTKFVVERERKYIDALLSNQPELFNEKTIVIESSIEDVDITGDCEIDILISGLPCTASSLAGKTKNKISAAEQHKDAGAVFHYWLNFVTRFLPGVIVLENVPNFAKEMSYSVIQNVLTTFGYNIHFEVLNGNDFGALEGRDRMCMVAVLSELDRNVSFGFEDMVVVSEKEGSVSEILENIPADDKRWKEYTYLKEKQVRDEKDGKGFKRDMYTGVETSVKTIRRLYHKAGSCDQFVIHPTNPELSRLFTPKEHALIKGIPTDINLINNLSDTTAHEILGQSVVFPKFESVGLQIGSWLNKIVPKEHSVAA